MTSITRVSGELYSELNGDLNFEMVMTAATRSTTERSDSQVRELFNVWSLLIDFVFYLSVFRVYWPSSFRFQEADLRYFFFAGLTTRIWLGVSV